jgi:hypothetical protein
LGCLGGRGLSVFMPFSEEFRGSILHFIHPRWDVVLVF